MSAPEHGSYPIDGAEPPQEFLQARNVAGGTLESHFKKEAGKAEPSKDYRWIKAELTWPSFDHLTFGYGNQVFSVLVDLVDLVDGGTSALSQLERDRCLKACRENNLVPCLFRVDARTFQPMEAGWNLRHLEDQQPVVPAEHATAEKIPMSAWERRNFAIQVVRDHIKEKRGTATLSFCDVLGIDPQIWFEEANGARCWVIVRDYGIIRGDEKQEFIGIEKLHAQLRPFDGFFAAVSFASSEPVLLDLDGKIIPLSKRFDGTAPLYRGDGCHIKFTSLERIHVS